MADIMKLFPEGQPPRPVERRPETALVQPFRGRVHHRDLGCTNRTGTIRDDGGCCPCCDWGAFMCAVCGGAEGEVPTDCPGREMSELERDSVMAGSLDYIQAAGGWVRRSSRERYRCE